MSNTIVTNYSNASGKSTNTDKSLVILVNKNGSVSLEKDTIQSLIDNQYEKTTVSIVRMNEDGKPDDASDHSSDETIPHINVTVDAFFDASPNLDDKDSHNDYVSDLFGSEIPLIGFQNDHCYTPLTSPSQSRRNSDCDSIVYKDEIVNTQKSYIPSSKKITVLENKIIAKGKNIQYYHPSGTREILKGSDLLKRPISAQNLQLVRKIETDRHQLKSIDNENILNKRLLDISKLEAFNSEQNPDRNTLIINQDGNVQTIKKSLLKKDVKKILSRKIELKNNGLANSSISLDRDQSNASRNRKVTKSYSTQKIVDEKGKSYILKNEYSKGGDGVKHTLLLNSKLGGYEVSKESLKPDVKLDAQKNQQKSVLKKDKKSHMTALFNDINSLFASPDVIRRVSTDSKVPDQLSGNLLKKEDMPFSTSEADKISTDLLDSKMLSRTNLKSHTNSTNKNMVRSMSDVSSRRHKNQKEGLDIISPFDDESLVQLLQETTNSEMLSPANIPLDIGPVTVQTSMLDKHDATNSINNSALISPTSLGAAGINAPLSPSLDLLSGLHPEEEGLPEDLLRHVAQLVESSENLQEVIDKEVLGKVNIHTKQIPQAAPQHLNKIEHGMQSHHLMPEVDKLSNSQNVIRKEPIQIVRSNGRIITLPPIEAPATRSSKRKSLMNAVEVNPGISNPDLTKVTPNVLTPTKQPINTYSRSHKASESKSTSLLPTDKKDDDAESDESWNSEDDPDRLWCICKQPHNNRFMICCDSCEDWFHGKCVNVTKAMGQEMEEKGIEWRCPSCVKKKGLANPSLKSLTSLRKSTEARVDERSPRLSTDNGSALDSNTSCIVCKKPARASSIYCSNACILKHAQESLTLTSPVQSVKNIRDNTLNKPKPETRVIVIERKTGHVLAGPNAPTTSNLKTWLQEHPTYEVIQPNIVKSSPTLTKVKPKSNAPKLQSVLTIGQDKQISFISSTLKSPTAGVKLAPKTVSPNQQSNLKSPTSINRPQTPKTLVKSPPPVKVQTPQQKQTPLKSPTPSTSQKKDETFTPQRYSNSTEPVRDNVKKTLFDEISKRMAESKDVKFTNEEILKFSTETEYELHDLFKDVGAKYKVKYRSLMFNLKDRKNLTLWQKICDRSITPKQLVRLSPEDLASQELAQWRDQEVKHQLELIKKSELDLLACNKTYVLKTHKGEEVMESRTTGTAELDPNVSVEDLVSALNKSVDGVGNSISGENKQSSPVPSRDKGHSSHHKHSRHKSKSSKSSKSSGSKSDHSSSKHDSMSSKHKSSKESRSDSRSHHRKSSRDRSRKSSSSRRHSESSRHSSHSKSSKHDDKKRSNDNRRSSSSSKDDRNSKETDYKKDVNEIKLDIMGLENIRSPVLYDNKGDDEIGNDLMSPNSDSLKSPVTSELGSAQKILAGNTESDQEPSSTVDSMIWNGIINMIDVARFSVTAHEVSGQCDDIIQELESELDVVGRISPETVWDYISKMRKQGYNDISVLRFIAAADEDKSQYMTLYNYLSTRSRLGVIRATIGGIKDFYILPLSSQAPLPPVLLPLQGPGFEESKPHLLLGIIVKQRRKRASHFSTLSAIPSKISKLANSDRSYTPPTDSSYTPPSSPKRKTASAVISGMPLPSFLPNLSSTVRDKIAASLASAGDDEPYSPGGSDSGSLERSHSPAVKQSTTTSEDFQKKMEELTRKIEEEKKQIENMAGTISGDSLDEPYSPSRPMSPSSAENPLPGLSSISLPSNLHEILASIHKNMKVPNNDLTDSQGSTEPYVPQAVLNPAVSLNPYFKEGFSGDVDMRMINTSGFPSQIPNFARNPDAPQKGAGKLSTLSEAELLSMVPDDEVLLPSNKINPVYPPLPNLPPPSLMTNTSVPPPPFKRQKVEYGQPPPPGFEDL